ncbi:MAG TPA: hypothetical protein DDZ76_13870 [Xanthomonadales bacterium]|nr:hypothetical protein [Xanthomonadales bacterium]
MVDHERRRPKPPHPESLRHGLSALQRQALVDLETFGWQLKFVRRRPFHPVVMFFHHPKRDVYAKVEEDGTLTENPPDPIRR